MDVSTIKASDVPVGEGVTGSINDRPVAIYNPGGELVVLENICTHMGCQTEWNAFDKTWDCPCHGSRYNAEGGVIHGPAPKPLPRLDYRIESDDIVII